MLTLCIDTAYKYLTCALIRDDQIISSYSKECFKKQSEEVFNALKEVFEGAGVERKAIDSICITEGPGSYTGVRIGMTIAKVIGETIPVDVYKISTLRLYAADRENCMVVMDARASRVYCGVYDRDLIVMDDQALEIRDVDVKDYLVVGDGSLVGKNNDYGDIAEAFLKTKHLWEKVENISYLVPKYLKESESYYR
ncbi:MAG: tRNA (adenosine(37)-N6)-threonylcarbamoyltransferase complex dimerization subunit type 1 TsaB [Erysipelotrichaceae bacterium]|jgi:tRNA threonylcarbamoyl adenosine modification protein YeaZ|nr:tRNA (adenosine(37)-N6)-threonylcarbamoyltransferase complex dimerization subunit type 1 TsaB [Erysipelotrichaceae bacterium]